MRNVTKFTIFLTDNVLSFRFIEQAKEMNELKQSIERQRRINDDIYEKQKKSQDGHWPGGHYCVLSNGGCPEGFIETDGFMRGIKLFSVESNYLKMVKFGDSVLKVHNYHNNDAELHIFACCK